MPFSITKGITITKSPSIFLSSSTTRRTTLTATTKTSTRLRTTTPAGKLFKTSKTRNLFKTTKCTNLFYMVLIAVTIDVLMTKTTIGGVEAMVTKDLFSNSFLVRLRRDVPHDQAKEVAERNGFAYMGPVNKNFIFLNHNYRR